MTRRMCSTKALSAGTLGLLAAASLAGCEGEEDGRQDAQFHCGIERGGVEEVIDCDDINESDGTVNTGGGVYAVMIFSQPYAGGSGYAPGQALPANNQRQRIGYKDAAGRQRFGLPPSGKIANGTVKTGVLGKGGGPAPAKGGGVGGAKGSGGG